MIFCILKNHWSLDEKIQAVVFKTVDFKYQSESYFLQILAFWANQAPAASTVTQNSTTQKRIKIKRNADWHFDGWNATGGIRGKVWNLNFIGISRQIWSIGIRMMQGYIVIECSSTSKKNSQRPWWKKPAVVLKTVDLKYQNEPHDLQLFGFSAYHFSLSRNEMQKFIIE